MQRFERLRTGQPDILKLLIFVDKSLLSEKHYAESREIANRTFSCHYFKNDDFGELEIYIFEKK